MLVSSEFNNLANNNHGTFTGIMKDVLLPDLFNIATIITVSKV